MYSHIVYNRIKRIVMNTMKGVVIKLKNLQSLILEMELKIH